MVMRKFFLFRRSYRLLVSITAVVACVVALGYLGALLFQRVELYLQERSAAKRVEELGGEVNWQGTAVLTVSISRKFPDAMADALSTLSNLKAIVVWLTVASDSAIAELKNMKCLETIDLHGPAVSNTTIRCLQDVKGLRHLFLGSERITDAGLVHLAAFPSLEYLTINEGAITDAGMCHLKDLPNLKGLDLRNIALTDAGLASLASLKNLKTLRLYECKQITASGVQTLKQALPHTSIGWDKSAIPGDLY